MKNFEFLNILFVTLVLSVSSAQNNYLWGKIGNGDVMFVEDTIKKPFVMKWVVEKVFIFQQDTAYAHTITAIKIVNKQIANKGATAKLLRGGPGCKEAIIKFTSQPCHGIQDEVQIWVHPNN